MPPWSVNAGFVVGEDSTLIIDTGANRAAAETIHGYASAVRPANRLLVLNTEKHFDHIGGNRYFREQGIDVYGHTGIERTEAEFRSELADFNAAIPQPARRTRGEERVFYQGAYVTNPNRPIRDDTEIDLGGCRLKVLLTPGHTPTNVSVYVPGDSVVYCGDCLTNEYLPNLDCGGPVEWWEWLQSLNRIAALEPSIIMPGHGPVATGTEVPRLFDTMRGILTEAIGTGRSPTAEHA